MIFTDRTITVKKGASSIDDAIVLYRGDKEVEIRFTLSESLPFRFGSGAEPNIIEKTEAAYGQLIIKTPNDLPAIFSEVAPTNNGKIVFTITTEMIDEITEVGNYTFQIRLLDESRNSRATIPEVVNGIEIREPIATEDVSTTNEVGVATVGYALTTAATAEDAFDSQGNYNKTTWGPGDRITDAKLNKIEDGITGVNQKADSVATLIPTKTSQLTNDSDFATNASVDEKISNIEITGSGGTVGVSYDEVNEELTFVESDIVTGGGLTNVAQTLLISILRSAVFTSDQSANIVLLQSELAKGGSSGGGSETTKYTITNTLDNATTSNSAVLVDANSSYTATIRENDGYTLDAITVTMGGIDITSSAVSGTTITITSVTGNVVITVTTTESGSSSGGGMVTDGLVNYFDFRTADYNNSGAGGSTIINATQGNASLFCWAGDTISTQDEYGITQANTRSWIYSATGGTTQITITGSFTVACYGYTNSNTQFFGTWGRYTNLAPNIKLQPTYNTSSSTASVTVEQYATSDLPNGSGFRSYIVTADADTGIAKIYIGGVLARTYTGSDYNDFVSWYINSIGVTQTSVKLTACAIYNRPFTDIEAVDMHDFFKTLEVK